MNYHTIILILLLLPAICLAHKPSDSYLSLDLSGDTIAGRWDIALRDLEYALGLDADGDGNITWGELKARHEAIADYALARFNLKAGNGFCALHPGIQQVENHSDGAYTVLNFRADCPNGALSLEYRLFFDLDPSHRGLLRLDYADGTQTAVLSPEQPRIELRGNKRSAWRQFGEYWREGVWHIWIGFDHILFLLALLLPAVIWREQATLRAVLLDVAAIVTAFTVAHSITLAAAVLDWINLPARWVESAIAATVMLAALNNLVPVVREKRWAIAFALGLIHGFGFAGVLADLGLSSQTLFLALAGFNLGVECGQLVIVAALVPIAFVLRDTWFYRRAIVGLGSLVVAMIGFVWLLERSLDMRLML